MSSINFYFRAYYYCPCKFSEMNTGKVVSGMTEELLELIIHDKRKTTTMTVVLPDLPQKHEWTCLSTSTGDDRVNFSLDGLQQHYRKNHHRHNHP